MAEGSTPGSEGVPPGYEPPQSAAELLRRYAAGERQFPHADLPEGSSLRGANLAGVAFAQAWLSGVDFTGADLRRVRFADCNVKCSDFGGADLRGASFPGTHVEAADFAGANLEGADFAGARAYGGAFRAGETP
jgi:uncharacterized protein YjbI with pentapeptide repeats